MGLFKLGQITSTSAAMDLLEENNESCISLLRKHVSGDFGDALCEEDKELNLQSIENGSRILSAYNVGDEKIWIITEADRSSSCLLLPAEY